MNIKEITIVVIAALLVGLGGCWILKYNKKVDSNTTSNVLPPDAKQKIIFNPINNTLEVIKPGSDKKTFLPDRPVSIIEDKNGNLVIDARTWGFQKRPYVGFGYSNTFRVYGGLDWFYWNRFDVGTGLNMDTTHLKDTALDLNLSYNFYSHTSIAVSYSSNRMIGAFIKLRF